MTSDRLTPDGLTPETTGTRPAAPVPARALWRALIRWEPQKIIPEIAIRNTAGFTFAVILGAVLSSPSTGVVAGLGALNVCYSDGRDPYRTRARRMLISTLLVGCAVILGSISAHSNFWAVTTAAVWAFAAGMMVALGTTAADLGVITLVTLVVFAAKPQPPTQAVQAGLVAMGGGLVQTLLSTLLWPIRRYAPERKILAGIYTELADVAKAPPPAANAPPMSRQISDAHDALAPLARDHSSEAERHVFLLVQAERIRLSVVNMGRLQRRLARHEAGETAATALGKILACASDAIGFIGQRLESGDTAASASRAPVSRALDALTASLVEFQTFQPPQGDAFFAALLRDAKFQATALRSQIRSAAFAGRDDRGRPGTNSGDRSEAGVEAKDDWRLRFTGYRARLLANLSFDSTVFRHAVRMAACLALGDAIGRGIGLQRTYWIPMTIAIVLKPDFTGTVARGVLRVGGTMAGLVLATLLFRFIHAGIGTDIALMAVFTLVLRWYGPANYGIFVAVVSGLVVLLIAVTGVAPEAVIAARAANTAIGGALALLAYIVWPTWEKGQTHTTLANMLDAYREYTDAVLTAFEGGSLAIGPVRVRARRARTNAQASVDRLTGEPGTTQRQEAALNKILVDSHSFVHAAMAMESRLYRELRDPAPPWMPAFAASVDRALSTLSEILKNETILGNAVGTGARRSRIDVEVPAPGQSGNELLETEADRMRTSLRSLGEEIAKRDWV